MPNEKLWAKNLDYFPLNYLLVILTQKCNLKCDYCLRGANSKKGDDLEIPFEKLKHIIISAHRAGCRGAGLTGGEFYLYSKWQDLVLLLGQLKWNCLIETNGIAISKNSSLLEFTKKAIGNRLSIRVSLDSYNEQKHDLHRGKRTFKKVLEAINLIVLNKIKLDVNAILTPDNLMTNEDVNKYIKFCKKLGVRKISIGRVVAEARGNNQDLILSPTQTKQIVNVLNQYNKENPDSLIARGFFRNKDQGVECNIMGREICVSPFGLHPCIFHQEIIVGDFDDFDKIIWSEFFQSFGLLQKCSRTGHRGESFTCFDCTSLLPEYIRKLKTLKLISI